MKKLKNDELLIDAEMVNKANPDMLLTGSLPVSKLSIPAHIGLAGNNLYFWDDPGDDYKRHQANDTGALTAFVRIEAPKDILRFAERYGPLGLCRHGRPPMHRGRDRERRWCAPHGHEPFKRWLEYVGLAKSCLKFAAQMKVDTEKIIAKGVGKLFVIDIINEWLGDAGINLEVDWHSREPTLLLNCNSVFDALGVQLLSVITRSNLAVCSGCGIPYIREMRKPQTGRRNFCKECGTKVANRLRQRTKRMKLREEEKIRH